MVFSFGYVWNGLNGRGTPVRADTPYEDPNLANQNHRKLGEAILDYIVILIPIYLYT